MTFSDVMVATPAPTSTCASEISQTEELCVSDGADGDAAGDPASTSRSILPWSVCPSRVSCKTIRSIRGLLPSAVPIVTSAAATTP